MTGGDEVFRGLVPARIIEPVSKLDSLGVLEEIGSCSTAAQGKIALALWRHVC